ncbi:MAG: MFS transporter [Planctomycetota bacterium]|nr:MAG: MFS transporter [Planctomycetota bacterium]
MSAVAARLSIMMFLEFFIWGAWQVTAAKYLGLIGFTGDDIGWTYAVGPIAGMISPFFVGVVADRFMATEKVLGLLHLLGGVLMYLATRLMTGDSPSPFAINLMIFIYALTYFPTIALANSLAMHTMTDASKEFPRVRVFGTIGWIVAGITLAATGWGNTVGMFHLAAATAVLMGLYSFTLPHVPPPAKGQEVSIREILGLDALVLLRNRSFLVFLVSSFLICIPLAFYYQLAERTVTQAGIANPPFKMTFGQMSEIFFMLVMPWFFARLGVKWMLLAGMAAWVLRYTLFAIGAPEGIAWMIYLGVLLHGVCYDFFFVTGQIYTDMAAPAKIRAQAQGLLVLFTLGLGMCIGAIVAGRIERYYTPPQVQAMKEEAQATAARVEALEAAKLTGEAESTSSAELDAARAKLNEQTVAYLKLLDWRKIWGIPAVLAAVIMVIFALTFRDNGQRGAAASDGSG